MQYTAINSEGDNVYVAYYDEDGNKCFKTDKINPSLFIRSNNGKYKNLKGQKLEEKKFESIKDAYDFIKNHKYDDYVYGYERWLHQYISREFKNQTPDINKLRVHFVDIETTAYNAVNLVDFEEEITCLTVYDNQTHEYKIWGIFEYTGKEDINYIYCKDEKDLLEKYLNFHISNGYCDVLVGWNFLKFDCPYIINRMKKVLPRGKWKTYSPWKIIHELESKPLFGEVEEDKECEKYYKIFGIEILDYLDMYKKLPKGQPENYKLDTIAELELNERKIAHDEYETFNDFWQKDWNLFVEYNIHDVRIVKKLDDKLALINIYCNMGYDTLCNFTDGFHQVRMWDNIVYNYLLDKNIIVPLQINTNETDKFRGAYVKPTIAGKFEWIVSYDLASLYPSVIRTINISPDTFVDKVETPIYNSLVEREYEIDQGDCSFAANGALFTNKKKGFLPEILTEMYAKRSDYKKKMLSHKKEVELLTQNKEQNELEIKRLKILINQYDIKQNSIKVQLNSAFGWLGCPYSRFYSKDYAEAITITGQLVTRTIFEAVNKYLDKITNTNKDRVLMSDTDSLFVTFEDIVNKKLSLSSTVKKLEKFSKEVIEPLIVDSVEGLAKYLNVYENVLSTKLEKIASVGVITKKKRYMMFVHYNEGIYYTNPTLTVVGMDTVRSTTPRYYRDKLKTAFEMICNKDNIDLIKYIGEIKKDTYNQQIEDIAFPKGVSNIEKYKSNDYKGFKKGTPINARATMLYNNLIKEKNLEHKYELIKEDDKIKFIYLKMPNPLFSDVVAFVGKMPKEFNIEKYIDYNMQFEKCFLSTLETICEIIGWKTKEIKTLDEDLD